MSKKLWNTIIESWDAFWESYEITYVHEYEPQLLGFEFRKPPYIL